MSLRSNCQNNNVKAEKIFYYFLQYTWGLILNMVGIGLMVSLRRQKHFKYHYAYVTYWNRSGSMAIGMFIFLEKGMEAAEEKRILYHEYGHTFQSALLGPLYLLIIALPSLAWANLSFFSTYRLRKDRSYYSFYPEKWADAIGKKKTDKKE